MKPKSSVSLMMGLLLAAREEGKQATDAIFALTSAMPSGTVKTYYLSTTDEDFLWKVLQAAEDGNKEVIDLKVRGTSTKSTRVNITITVKQK